MPLQPADRETESRIPLAEIGGASARLSLLVMGEKGVFAHPLPERGELRIGRGAGCGIVVDDPQLSREHALLRVGPTLTLTDLGSSNGTVVRGKTLATGVAVELAAGDVIALGATVITLQPTTARARACGEWSSTRAVPAGGALERLRPIVERVAAGSISVLVMGETGVGKDVLCSAIHARSPRADKAFVCLNCAALPEQLLESELFGYERGAFTGAQTAKPGLLEVADGGTVFLDEVAEMPLSVQAKLLRVLDHGEVLRVGALKPRKTDVRFIAATNRDLDAEVKRGTFREDLLYRLNGATIVVPPLRERTSEIATLAETFAAEAARRLGAAAPRIEPDAMDLLVRHAWPGNVRELRNVIERAVLLADRGVVRREHLPVERMAPAADAREDTQPPPRAATPEEERAAIVAALAACKGNQTHAARALGVSRRTLIGRIAAHGLPRPRNGRRP